MIAPLYEHLAAFVPLEIRELQRFDGPQEWQIEEAKRHWRKLKENPDTDTSILFADHKQGQTRSAIAMLVECLAIMAFVPGGVKFGPLHFWPNREEDEKTL